VNAVTEALTVKTGATYAVTGIELSAPRKESFESSASGAAGRRYFRQLLSICDISFRTPLSDLRPGTCGAMTHGDEVWRVRVTHVSQQERSLAVRGVALVSDTVEWLDSAPSPEPPATIPSIWWQFYDL
jgi:hypothetical protein